MMMMTMIKSSLFCVMATIFLSSSSSNVQVSAFLTPKTACGSSKIVSMQTFLHGQSPLQSSPSRPVDGDNSEAATAVRKASSRRSFVEHMVTAAATAAVTTSSAIPTRPVYASGGATAGGAYLLSAKQRYNERVKTAVQGLLKAADALKNGDSKAAKTYLDGEDAGSWKDLTAAGYLLSNAFRRNSTTAPDSLPSVKKYKAFAGEVEDLRKTLKKKGAQAASEQFGTVEAALNEWLAEIELPSAREL